jgi:N-acetylneuraminate synthase
MVQEVRILERALGSAEKHVAENEKETYIVQRHCLRAARDIIAGETLIEEMLEVLRPATPGALMAWDIPQVMGKKAARDLPFGKDLRWEDLK